MIIENVSNILIRIDGVEYLKHPFIAIASTDYVKIIATGDKDTQIGVSRYDQTQIDGKRYGSSGGCVTAINNLIQTAHIDVESTARSVATDVATAITADTIQSSKALIPKGFVGMWSGTTPPNGWALCDGTNGTPDLRGRFIVGYHSGDSDYNAIGKTSGAKTVTLTTSQMPSHNHSASISGSHTHGMGYAGGHNHTIRDPQHRHSITGRVMQKDGSSTKSVVAIDGGGDPTHGNRTYYDRIGYSSTGVYINDGAGNHYHSISLAGDHTHSITNTGGGVAHENRPPYYTLAYIMKL